MKRSRFTEDQFIGILKEHEAGVSTRDFVLASPNDGVASHKASEIRHKKSPVAQSEYPSATKNGCPKATVCQ